METIDIIIMILACIISYLIGSVSIARFLTKKEVIGNISSQGSGNPGTMNMLRTHGMGMGFFTLMCDALKGAIPALFGLLYFEKYDMELAYLTLYLFGFCAVLGHIFPVFYKFKGGKGIATTFGIFLVADPILSVILFGILFLTLYCIRIGSVVSLLFVTIISIVQLFRPVMGSNTFAIILMLMILFLDIYAHRSNLLRLIENKENPADLQESLEKDIDKIKTIKEKKLEKNAEKSNKIEEKYNNKITKKNNKVKKKIDRINKSSSGA